MLSNPNFRQVESFPPPGFVGAFKAGTMTLGFLLPLEAYPDSPAPLMSSPGRAERLADELGFAALWARDVPTYDPTFGDVGQIFDPFTYLAFLAATTRRIALGTGSSIVTLRHPLHVAKQASSVDRLSSGRLLLGVASGDRPREYNAVGIAGDYATRAERFREALSYIRLVTEQRFPSGSFPRYGDLSGDLGTLPAPFAGRLPIFVTGHSRQDLDWIALHADGWLYYFVHPEKIGGLTRSWHDAVSRQMGPGCFKPFIQGLFLDLDPNPDAGLVLIHQGIRCGRNVLRRYLHGLRNDGVSHTVFNLKQARRPAVEIIDEVAEFILPEFPTHHALRPVPAIGRE